MSDPPVIGFAGYSGSGKTTLIEKLIPCLKDKNIRIGLIKHAHHKFDIDQPGKDSYRFRKAGALQVLVASSQRWALMTETPDQHSDPVLRTLIQRLDRTSLDLIMVEGFKHETIPKIEVYRKTDNRPPLCLEKGGGYIAVATDVDFIENCHAPLLNLNDQAEITQFIVKILSIE